MALNALRCRLLPIVLGKPQMVDVIPTRRLPIPEPVGDLAGMVKLGKIAVTFAPWALPGALIVRWLFQPILADEPPKDVLAKPE